MEAACFAPSQKEKIRRCKRRRGKKEEEEKEERERVREIKRCGIRKRRERGGTIGRRWTSGCEGRALSDRQREVQ